MESNEIEIIEILDKIIIGRVEPVIYAFITNTVPNYLKVGDTYRPVTTRLNEWRRVFPDLIKQFEDKATVSEDVYFRDYAVHYFLENDLSKSRLRTSDVEEGEYYSNEFFKDTKKDDLVEAINDIKIHHNHTVAKYDYYSSQNRLPQVFHYERQGSWDLRPNQKAAVEEFKKAVNNGRANLLMYAVMRFGKSFTSLCCALEISSKITLVVSAKADVKDEWKKTVESAGNFEGFVFLEGSDLQTNQNIIQEKLDSSYKVVLFLTLQDLQGDEIKEKHAQIFEQEIDLLIVDETHFGARAESFGAILRDEQNNIKKFNDEVIDNDVAIEQLKALNAKVKLHLSGTPYRILMGDEFEKDDIISFVQFSDIVREKEEWDIKYLNKDNVNEWDNPYFGFPQMIRFAFNANKSSVERMNRLKNEGISFTLSALFKPMAIRIDAQNNRHKKFFFEDEILDLLQVIDGSKEDDNLLGFLDYDKIKEGKMCRHVVMVLPYCASCDAMEELIKKNCIKFKNLNQYEIVNISGVEGGARYRTPNEVKNVIKNHESMNIKTLTLTVNRMLTGSTVEQWDTMLYLKDTSSPQEYDQAIFRLQNQYVRTLLSDQDIIKENLKPQTILVDFDPNRLFRMQEQKALIYNVNTEKNGNSKLIDRIREELRISPIITMNQNKIHQVEATNILEAVSNYNKNRSVSDEVIDLPIDYSILEDDIIRRAIESQSEFNSKGGLSIKPVEGDEDELDISKPSPTENDEENGAKGTSSSTTGHRENDVKKLDKKIQTYYQRILFFSFLSKNEVSSLDDIIAVLEKDENSRLARNLNLDINVLIRLTYSMDPFKRSSLDYKIQNISKLASDSNMTPIERAMMSLNKFNRMSESEVITPVKVCDEMVNLIPDEGLREIINSGNKLLDIASKSGEYAVSLYRRLIENMGYCHDDVKNSIYSIPTSSIAYEFTRRFYEILELNIENIASHFNSYDLLNVIEEDNQVNYIRIVDLLSQNKKFETILLNDELVEGDEKVRFGAIVGNPPYQQGEGENTRKSPIYNYFFEMSFLLSNTVVIISPARFLFDAGQTPKSWNMKMLQDTHFSVAKYYSDSKQVFDNVEIKGGIAITVRDTSKIFGGIEVFTPYNELNSIIHKIKGYYGESFESISNIISSQGIYRFSDLALKENPSISAISGRGTGNKIISRIVTSLPEVFTENPIDGYANVSLLSRVSNGRVSKYIKRSYLQENEFIDNYNVLVAESNGSGAFDVFSSPVIAPPLYGSTDTFISIGMLDTLYEAQALTKYIKTKFLRAMLGVKKATQHNPKSVWQYVPIQSFSDNSDIDWSKSISEIDAQLYKKYSLEKDEIDFIESKVPEMEHNQ